MFGDVKIGYILLISHILACLVVGLVFRNWKKDVIRRKLFSKKEDKQKQVRLRDLGGILGEAIKKSIVTILNIGGFIVIFSVILSILKSGSFFMVVENICKILNIQEGIGTSVVSGIIELTNGVSSLSVLGSANYLIILASFLLGFGGISVLLQVYSIIVGSGISIRPYFYGKVLQGVISALFTAIILMML